MIPRPVPPPNVDIRVGCMIVAIAGAVVSCVVLLAALRAA
jgi:hypothetical protein